MIKRLATRALRAFGGWLESRVIPHSHYGYEESTGTWHYSREEIERLVAHNAWLITANRSLHRLAARLEGASLA